MFTNIDIIDSIVICKGNHAYYAYLRFKDSFYDKNLSNPNPELLHSSIDNYLFKLFRTIPR